MGVFRHIFGASGEEEPEEPPKKDQPETEQTTNESNTRPIADGVTHRLPMEDVITHANAHLTFGQASDVGQMRENNEDAVFSLMATSSSADDYPDFGLFIVADGMGGHQQGERASSFAVSAVAAHVMKAVHVPVMTGDKDVPPLTEVLVEAIQGANDRIQTELPEVGGTTCTVLATLGDRAYIAHVGDSRAYLVTREGLEPITRDHSTVQRLVEVGQITQEEAADHPRGSELYRALGINQEVDVDVAVRRLRPETKFLLCSDGLWNFVDEKIIHNVASSYDDPQSACNRLVAMANGNGGKDNITVIIVSVN